MSDKVFIEGLEIDALIGIYDWERRIRQTLVFDIEMAFDNRIPAASDDIALTLNYKDVSKRLIEYVGVSGFGLVETLAERCAAIILTEFNVSHVRLKLSKPGAVRGARAVGVIIERLFLKRLYKLDPIYGLLLTFGLALIIEGIFREMYGTSGQAYSVPEALSGATNLGFMVLPNYRAWVVLASLAVCMGTWYLIERTRLGAYLRAGTENAALVQAFGINVPLMVMLTYGAGAALAGLAGVLAAPIILVNPTMGSNLIIVVFAVVVIGGMGSIMGSILTGLGLGIVEGLTRVFYPEASGIVVFVVMVIVLMFRPAGLFGKEA